MAESKTILTLQQYKEEIKELQAQMLNLEKDSDAYKKKASEISTMQSKLTQVMYDSKKGFDAVDNSITKLEQEYRELSRQAKNLDINSKAFKDLAEQAAKVKDQLNEAKMSMGDWSSNVGNYANSIVDSFNKMGISIGGLDKAFGIITAGATGFKTVLTALSKHPFLVAATVLVGLLVKIHDAISNNEQLSKRWQAVMASFEPVVNAINNVLDVFAQEFVTIAEKAGKYLPQVMQLLGKVSKFILNITSGIFEAVRAVSKPTLKVIDTISNAIFEAVKTTTSVLGKLFDAVGLDEWTKKMNTVVDTIGKIAKKGIEIRDKVLDKTPEILRKIGDTLDKNLQTTNKTVELKKTELELDKQRRENEQLALEDEKKQNELREKIMTSTGAERLKYINEYKKSVNEVAKRELSYANAMVELQKQRNALTPTSREENLRLEELQKNAKQVEVIQTAALAKIGKMEANAMKQSKAQAKLAIKEQKEASAQIIKDLNVQLEEIRLKTTQKSQESKSLEELANASGILTPAKAQEFINEQHKIKENELQEQIKLTTNALSQLDKLTLEDATKLNNQLLKLNIQLVDEQNDYELKTKKNTLNKIKLETKQAYEKIGEETSTKLFGTDQDYASELLLINSYYIEGVIDKTEYEQKITDLNNEYENKRLDVNIEAAKKREETAKQEYEQILQQYGPDSQDTIDAYKIWQESITNVQETETNKRLALSEQEIQASEKAKTELKNKLNSYKEFASSVSNLMGIVSNAIEQNNKIDEKATKEERERAKNRFKTMKAMQISAAVIDMLAGGLGAYMSWMRADKTPGVPAWMQPVLGGIQMATTLATGATTIAQIAKTKFDEGSGSSSVSGGALTVGAAVQPLLDVNQDVGTISGIQTAQSQIEQNDTRVYILQQDIEDSNKQVQIRENNTTW